MVLTNRFREAASVHVRIPAERVARLLREPRILRALDPRLSDERIELDHSDGGVEVRDRRGRLKLSLTFLPDEAGTRIAATESVQPSNPIEATKHMLFPGHVHDEFQEELDRLAILLEAVDSLPQA